MNFYKVLAIGCGRNSHDKLSRKPSIPFREVNSHEKIANNFLKTKYFKPKINNEKGLYDELQPWEKHEEDHGFGDFHYE